MADFMNHYVCRDESQLLIGGPFGGEVYKIPNISDFLQLAKRQDEEIIPPLLDTSESIENIKAEYVVYCRFNLNGKDVFVHEDIKHSENPIEQILTILLNNYKKD